MAFFRASRIVLSDCSCISKDKKLIISLGDKMKILKFNKIIVISFLIIMVSIALTLYIKQNSSTNVPKSATLVLHRMEGSYE